MSTNPNDGLQPDSGSPASRDAIASKVSGPAIALIVAGVINVLISLYSIVNNAMTMMAGDAALQQNPAFQQNPGLQELQNQGFDPMQFIRVAGTAGIAIAILGLIIGIVIVMGGMKMKNLQSHGFAFTSSILAMIPCLSSCCIVGLPIGIWCVIVLNKPEVKSAFH